MNKTLTVIACLAIFFAGCKKEDDKQFKIAYIYTSNDLGYPALLNFYNYPTTKLTLVQADSTDFRKYDLIIISDDDTLSDNLSNISMQSISDSQKPIICIGQRGSKYFKTINPTSSISQGNCIHVNAKTVSIVDPKEKIWLKPNSIDTSKTVVEIYIAVKGDALSVAAYLPNIITQLGMMEYYSEYYIIVKERNWLLWGFGGCLEASELTEDGSKLFLNCVDLMLHSQK